MKNEKTWQTYGDRARYAARRQYGLWACRLRRRSAGRTDDDPFLVHIEDGVYVDGDNRQNIERTALYVDTPDVLTVTDENFKSWAIEGLFTDLSDYYANDPGDYTEEGIPEAYTQTFRIDKEVGENGIRMAGEGADLQGVPFGADPMAYYYSLPAFENQGINIISVAEEDLDGTGTYAKVQPHGYAEYKESPFEGAVSSTNLAGDTVYKVFNNRIPMNWEEFRYLSKMFTRSSAYNPDSPTTYGSGTHWWFGTRGRWAATASAGTAKITTFRWRTRAQTILSSPKRWN